MSVIFRTEQIGVVKHQREVIPATVGNLLTHINGWLFCLRG